MANEAIKHLDLTDEQIAFVRASITKHIYDNPFWDKLCDHDAKWNNGYSKMTWRELVYKPLNPERLKPLEEDIAPKPGEIEVATFEVEPKTYRGKYIYTDFSVKYNFDDVVDNVTTSVTNETRQVSESLRANAFLMGRSILTVKTGESIVALLDRAWTIFTKSQPRVQPYADGKYLVVLPSELYTKLKNELRQQGISLAEPTKQALDDGVIASYDRWYIKTNSDETMYPDKANGYILFVARDDNGRLPVRVPSASVEVIHNPLGSGVMKDNDGNITSDDNKQRGSIAWNLHGFYAVVQSDTALIRALYPIADGVVEQVAPEIIGRNNFVSRSISPVASGTATLALALSAESVKAGASIDCTPTITIDGKAATDEPIYFASLDTNVATVGATGKVVGVKAGKTKIKAVLLRYPTISAEVDLTVTA